MRHTPRVKMAGCVQLVFALEHHLIICMDMVSVWIWYPHGKILDTLLYLELQDLYD